MSQKSQIAGQRNFAFGRIASVSGNIKALIKEGHLTNYEQAILLNVTVSLDGLYEKRDERRLELFRQLNLIEEEEQV